MRESSISNTSGLAPRNYATARSRDYFLLRRDREETLLSSDSIFFSDDEEVKYNPVDFFVTSPSTLGRLNVSSCASIKISVDSR